MARAIEAAYAEGPVRGGEVLVGYLADKINIVHEPRQPEDGPRDGAMIGARRLRETTAFAKALQEFWEDTRVEVEGNYLLVTKTVRGRRANGETLAETVTSKVRVANGQIVEMLAVSQSASFGKIMEVLQEGGFAG
jgi:hypothetical protein